MVVVVVMATAMAIAIVSVTAVRVWMSRKAWQLQHGRAVNGTDVGVAVRWLLWRIQGKPLGRWHHRKPSGFCAVLVWCRRPCCALCQTSSLRIHSLRWRRRLTVMGTAKGTTKGVLRKAMIRWSKVSTRQPPERM